MGRRFIWGALAVACVVLSPAAWAQQPAPAAGEAPKSDAPAAWADTLKFSGQVEAGITFNPDEPADRRNFGHLFTDHANRPVMNQLLLTAQRPLDPKATDWDFGFKLQGMYGTDARYTHFLGELDRTIKGPYQVDIVEANLKIHAPIIGEGGMDITLGQYPTPLGYEVIDPSANPLYSHSYIFNFGVPLKHTGALTTTHVTSLLDVYLGIDTGVNTTFGHSGDNNDAIAGIAGLGLNMMDGNFTILALTHIGPENPRGAKDFSGNPIAVNSALRYLNDVVVTWKATEKLTSVTELNFIKDDGVKAMGWGLAQYVTYAFNDSWSITGRGEVWSDQNGFYVAEFLGNLDFVNAERGLPTSNGGVTGPGKATYTELTLGVSWKPEVPKTFEGFVVRPEVRYDHSNVKAFKDGKSNDQVTLAADFVLPF